MRTLRVCDRCAYAKRRTFPEVASAFDHEINRRATSPRRATQVSTKRAARGLFHGQTQMPLPGKSVASRTRTDHKHLTFASALQRRSAGFTKQRYLAFCFAGICEEITARGARARTSSCCFHFSRSHETSPKLSPCQFRGVVILRCTSTCPKGRLPSGDGNRLSKRNAVKMRVKRIPAETELN